MQPSKSYPLYFYYHKLLERKVYQHSKQFFSPVISLSYNYKDNIFLCQRAQGR